MVKKINKSKGKEKPAQVNFDEFEAALYKILNANRGHRELSDHQFRASELYFCDLELYLMKVFPEDKLPVKLGLKGTFMWGNAIHQFLQSELRIEEPDKFWGAERNIELDFGDIEISGHCDGLWLTDRLIEIKSANHWSFMHSVEDGYAKAHHMLQANFMASVLNTKLYTIVYVDRDASVKNDKIFAIFTYETDQEAAKHVISKMIHVYESVKRKEPPKPTPYSWECQYCSMRKKCKELGLKPKKSVVQEVNEMLRDDGK
jgi:CRISPR/Cas system-associated exonuclease Cas4 (RecB family)